jgi:hypothetical protein
MFWLMMLVTFGFLALLLDSLDVVLEMQVFGTDVRTGKDCSCRLRAATATIVAYKA